MFHSTYHDEQGNKENQQGDFDIFHGVIHFHFTRNEKQQGQSRGRNHPGLPADLVMDDEQHNHHAKHCQAFVPS